ncbi:tetratricopeptide repeat protein [Limoniibacter endophyticus]|uniref:Membrane protein n=1 Tax=Limoniibacter endophyticus TaxID=1565040 RepID=A0A8J3DIG3_9HYPH|nr:tetratricopeptide repeat protein [Limoniibacter endophyticus]GHC71224.1 membrane protein [Limoniibacter endophyticus]
MSNDSFIREVNEEIRQDKMKALTRRFGPIVGAAAVLIILATVGWVAWDRWQKAEAGASGDQFISALELASDGKVDEAQSALQTIEKEGHGNYPTLAAFRLAGLAADKGEATAVQQFDAIAATGSAAAIVRDMARLRAGLLLVDSGSYEDVSARVEQLTADTNPLRHVAREALALSAYKARRMADARALFEQISNDAEAPGNVRGRAGLMLDLIKSGDGANE